MSPFSLPSRLPAALFLPFHCVCCQFFGAYNQLLQSDNFIVKVHAFNLLSTLLFERSNHDVMMKSAQATRTAVAVLTPASLSSSFRSLLLRYVNNPEHLRIAMVQLRLPNKALQLAVFNVLKVFIPNPFKADSIVRILTANKKNFLHFLNEFERDSSTPLTHTFYLTTCHRVARLLMHWMSVALALHVCRGRCADQSQEGDDRGLPQPGRHGPQQSDQQRGDDDAVNDRSAADETRIEQTTSPASVGWSPAVSSVKGCSVEVVAREATCTRLCAGSSRSQRRAVTEEGCGARGCIDEM